MSNKQEYFRTNITLAACPITGISISLGIPKIPHKVFEYQNPLALIDNAKDISQLPRISQLNLSPEILGGVLLSIFHNLHLVEDKLTATQRNILLQDVHKHHLCEALHLFGRITRKQAEKLPHLSLNYFDEEKYHKTADKIKEYTKECHEILFPTIEKREESAIYSVFTIGKVVELESYLTNEVRKEFKLLARTMFDNDEITNKTYSLLTVLAKDKNLISIDIDFRNRLLAKLETINSISSLRMAELIKSIAKNMNYEEIIFKQKTDSMGEDVSGEFPALPKKSLREILAAKGVK